jgi:hypothetical protein
VLELAAEAPHDVAIGLAERPRHALVIVVGEEIPERLRPLQARLPHLDLLQRHRRPHLAAEAESRPDPFGGLGQLRRGRGLVLVAPAPMLEPPLGHGFSRRGD